MKKTIQTKTKSSKKVKAPVKVPKITIRATRTFRKHLTNKKYVISQGGSRSGKSYSLSQQMFLFAISQPNQRITIVMQYLSTLKQTIYQDLKQIIRDAKIPKLCRYNKQSTTFYFWNGSQIELKGFSDSSGGLEKALGGTRHVLWIDECNGIPQHIYTQLEIRSDRIFLSYNPRAKFWVHEMMEDELYKKDIHFVHTTYKDNRYASPSQVASIKHRAERDENFKMVYLLGQLGVPVDAVFLEGKNYKIIGPSVPEDIRRTQIQYIGLDWGYTDPCAIVECYILLNKERTGISDIYVNELNYKSQMTNNGITHALKMHSLDRYICIADSSEPKSIEEIRLKGANIFGVKKGPNSIHWGLQILKNCTIHVTDRSTNLIKELQQYYYKTDSNGKYMLDKDGHQITCDEFNHLIDAMRYVSMYYTDQLSIKNKNIPRGKSGMRF